MKTIATAAALACAVLLSTAAQAQSIKGVGASFPGSVYTSWAFSYTKEKQVPVVYTATGSSDGVKRIQAREVDFGGTDVPLSADELARNKLFQFPTMVGGIVPVMNVKGVAPGKLKLTGLVLADLFSGKITQWNDARIAALNPGVELPRQAVVRVVREPASGSTAAFSSYLSRASADWAKRFGTDKSINWTGDVVIGKGNDGVAKAVKETAGAIGYVSFDRVLREKLTYPAIQNRSGHFVAPSEAGFRAAVKASELGKSDSENVSLIDLPGLDVWPITDATYVLVDQTPKSAAGATPVLRFFYWAFLKGDDLINGTGFAPLPSEVQARVVRRLADIRPVDGQPINLLARPHLHRLAQR